MCRCVCDAPDICRKSLQQQPPPLHATQSHLSKNGIFFFNENRFRIESPVAAPVSLLPCLHIKLIMRQTAAAAAVVLLDEIFYFYVMRFRSVAKVRRYTRRQMYRRQTQTNTERKIQFTISVFSGIVCGSHRLQSQSQPSQSCEFCV